MLDMLIMKKKNFQIYPKYLVGYGKTKIKTKTPTGLGIQNPDSATISML